MWLYIETLCPLLCNNRTFSISIISVFKYLKSLNPITGMSQRPSASDDQIPADLFLLLLTMAQLLES